MFQTLDTKNKCHAVYEDGVFHFDGVETQTFGLVVVP
jgi:hypothetical protein